MSELLVEVTRGPLVESRHFGDIAVVDREGRLLGAVGHPHRLTYARSAAKPFQAIPLIESGAADAFGLTSQEIAVACASHSGEEIHEDTVSRLLAKAGVDEGCLRCGVHAPYHAASHEALLRAGKQVRAIHNNCSGKHAGMLALAKYLGADLETYLDPDHPVQRRIFETISTLAGIRQEDIVRAVDGCSAPVFGLPLDRIALMYAKLASASGPSPLEQAMIRIYDAMSAHPQLVAGTDRFCTALIQAGGGRWIGKAGAEGVYGVAIRTLGVGIAVKVDDGNARAAYPAVVEVLSQLGALTAADHASLESFWHPVLRNHQAKEVGRIQPRFALRSAPA